jgi:hypothetical protein
MGKDTIDSDRDERSSGAFRPEANRFDLVLPQQWGTVLWQALVFAGACAIGTSVCLL